MTPMGSSRILLDFFVKNASMIIETQDLAAWLIGVVTQNHVAIALCTSCRI
jgi:hypothetical protein